MRELIARNGLEPTTLVSCIFTLTTGPRRRVPGAWRRARIGLRARAAALRARDRRPRLAAAGDPRAHPLLRADGHEPAARLPRRGAQPARRPRVPHNRQRHGPRVRSERSAGIPVYPAADGYALGRADVALLASQRVALSAAARRSSRRSQRALARRSTATRTRPTRALRSRARRPLRRPAPSASRSATAPATSCSPPARRCSSRAPSSSTPGRRSRSTRTSRRPPARARSRSRSTPTTATTSTRWRRRSPSRRAW